MDVSPYEGSGSGDLTDSFITPFISSRALISDFRDISETPGQLYAYRVSNTTVILATRSASSLSGDIEFSVGLSSAAEGRYLCQAVTFANGTSESVVTIQVVESK